MSYKTYPEMKDSGVELIGEIPVHWKIASIKRVLEMPVTDGPHETPEILDDGVPFISAESIKENFIDFSKKRGFISEEDHYRYCLKYKPRRNDIYMIKSGATTGNLAIVETDEEFSIWSPLAAIRADIKKVTPRFLLATMNSNEFQTSVKMFWNYGTQQNIGMNVIENLVISLAPLLEQTKIANFLDRKTAAIDALITKKQRQIELLQEKRQIIINNAVIKGLDPHAPMKNSGVEWIGEIPVEWDVKKTKYLSRFSNGYSYSSDDWVDVGHPVVRMSNISELGYLNLNENNTKFISESVANKTTGFKLEKNDILIAMTDMSPKMGILGKTVIFYNNDRTHYLNQRVGRIVVGEKYILVKFMHYFTNCGCFRDQIKSQVYPNVQYNASTESILNAVITVPPIIKQDEIVTFLDRKTAEIDISVSTIQFSIDKLREYRTVLISNAVTGKIDVREESEASA